MDKQSNSPCFLEGGEGTVLFNGLESFYRDIHNDGLPELCDVDTASLEVRLAADLAGRVVERRTLRVRVPPADLRALTGNLAGACHSRRMVA